ncbi:MAG: YciI family protein [Pyrinomonadaceae bacterium]
MRTRLIFILITALSLAAISHATPPQKPEPKSGTQAAPQPTAKPKMVEFHMALLKHGPKWTAAKNPETARLHQQHIAYVMSLFESGKAVIAGPFADGGEIDGVFVFRAKSAAEAKAWAEADPTVASGFRSAEMHPWWSQDIFGKPVSPMKLTPTYFCFLTKGAKWTPEKTPATEEIQRGHIANINRLAEMKKLVAAGPFGDDGRLRGIFVFRVGSVEEAKALTATDPAVQAGRLAIEFHPWWIPEGVLP